MRKLLLGMLLAATISASAANNGSSLVKTQFYGTDFTTQFDASRVVKVKKDDIKRIEKCMAWLEGASAVALKDCQQLKQAQNLNDWGYVMLTSKVSEAALGKTNEAVLLMASLLARSGYDVRVAGQNGKRLRLLYATDATVMGKSSFTVDGVNYVLFGDIAKDNEKWAVKPALNKGGQKVSFRNLASQQLAENLSSPRKVTSTMNADFTFFVSVNKNLVEFYGDVPDVQYGDNFMTRWADIANLPLEKQLQEGLVPQLKLKVAGMSQKDALQQLLWWVSTGFEYGMDEDIWKRDRVFYSEETLFYPQCDTEDRSILLSRLVRDVLGLKCVFIYYPGHTAIGVSITDADVRGAYVVKDGRHYVICDPTYIGGNIGEEMPAMAGKEKTIIELAN